MIAILCLLLSSSCENLQHIFENPKNKTVTVETDVPQDREIVNISSEEEPKYNSAKLEQRVLAGDWAIQEVKGKDAKGESSPFIKFAPSEKRIYGNNGCNVINADYNYNPSDSTLRFTNIIATTRACAMEDLTDYDINVALNDTRFYILDNVDSQNFLILQDANHKTIMLLMHQNFDFLNGAWNVTEIDGNYIENKEMQLVFDIAEMKIHGNTGCNILNGSIETDLETANTISFQKIATTRMACPDSSDETALLVALEEVMYLTPINNDKVELLDSRNKVVLKMTRISKQTASPLQ